MNKKRTRIDWHAGFAGGLGLCFSKYQDVLDIDREYELTKESPRINFIVIKKGRRGHNYPRKFFSECKKNNRNIEITAPGIYRVDGFSAIDLQIIVTRDLKDDSLLALKIMMEDAEKEDIRRFIESAEKIDAPGLLEDARAVIKVSSAVNEGIYEDVLKESSIPLHSGRQRSPFRDIISMKGDDNYGKCIYTCQN